MSSRLFVLVWALILCFCAQRSTGDSGAIFDVRGDPVNAFPITAEISVYNGQIKHARGTFKFFIDAGEQKYLPLGPELAGILSAPPIVESPQGLQVTVVRTRCTPRTLNLLIGTTVVPVEGAVMEWELEIAVDRNLPVGEYASVLSFTGVTSASGILRVDDDLQPVQVRLHVRNSIPADTQSESARTPIPQPQTAQLPGPESPSLVSRNQASDLMSQIGVLPIVVGTAGVLFMVFISWVAFRLRKWLWPNAKIKLPPGGHTQEHRAVAAKAGDEYEEPGTIIETLWAQNRKKQREKIKVEYLISAEYHDEDEATDPQRSVTTHHEFQSGNRPSFSALVNPQLDLLVSVGSSVTPGYYLAEGSHGTVRIQVFRGA